MLEFCDRGNLQDAVDRGVFAMKRSDPDSDEPPPRNVPAVVYVPRPAPARAISRLCGDVLRECGYMVSQVCAIARCKTVLDDGLSGREG